MGPSYVPLSRALVKTFEHSDTPGYGSPAVKWPNCKLFSVTVAIQFVHFTAEQGMVREEVMMPSDQDYLGSIQSVTIL